MAIKDFACFYKDKKVLVTGSSGFKGSWLTLCLSHFGANVLGYSLEPNTDPSMYLNLSIDSKIKNVYGDILDMKKLESTFSEFNPDIVFHLAAQPLVRLSYSEPLLTYQTNVIGTLNVLEAARKTKSVVSFVNITTDKCYENIEKDYAYDEDDKMGGYDMYSSSKACAEILSSSYRNSFLKEENTFALATARAGNVIGGGDWAADRLIPDCIRYINKDEDIVIRSPNAVRPWQHVLEPLGGYLLLGKLLFENYIDNKEKYSSAFNFGPETSDVLKVSEVVNNVIKYYERGNVRIEKSDNLHEANLLMLDIDKAKRELGWQPKYCATESIKNTVDWYKKFYSCDDNMLEFSIEQIEEYFN